MSIEAMKQALEALDRSDYLGWQANIPVMRTLRQAIAEAEKAEPVACITTAGNLMWVNQPSVIYSRAIPLYTHPPIRKPLTDEQIEDICWTEVDQRLRSFARAIERAHGIGD